MKIEGKREEYGSFTVEFSEKFEAQMRRAAERIVLVARKDPTMVEKILKNYCDMIESSVSLMLSIIGLALLRSEIMQHVVSTLKAYLEPLFDRLEREKPHEDAMN